MAHEPNVEYTGLTKFYGDRNPDASFFGQDVLDKIGFYGQAATVLRIGTARASQVACSITTSIGIGPNAGVGTATVFGFRSAAQADYIVNLLNEIRACLVGVSLMAGSPME